MNFFSKLIVVILIILSLLYVKDKFFNGNSELHFGKSNIKTEQKEIIVPKYEPNADEKNEEEISAEKQTVTIYFTNPANGTLKKVVKEFSKEIQRLSKLEFAVKELLKGPDAKERNAGYSSEIPKGTKLLSVKDQGGIIIVDISDEFQYGGGTESQYVRVNQLIQTILAQEPTKPVYLYLNGQKAEVIGGEGIIINQPLSENSLNG